MEYEEVLRTNYGATTEVLRRYYGGRLGAERLKKDTVSRVLFSKTS
jgi:hypothetical protein